MQWPEFFKQSLKELAANKLLRTRCWHVDHSPLILQRSDGTRLINFGSNDYLGLRHDRRLQAAAHQSGSGAGAGASPLVSGYNTMLAELEHRLARWQAAEAALVFTSGYALNVGLISALTTSDDLVVSDRLNHASLIDGCRLSRAHRRILPHNDTDALKQLFQAERHRYQRVLVLCEAIYSMDGDAAPLAELTALCEQYDAGLIVDEAHATGVYGPAGAGLGAQLHLSHRWLGKIGTLGKALGTSGGFITGSRDLIEFLANRCRSYVFSTAIAPPVVAATLAALELMPLLDDRRERLFKLSQEVRTRLQPRFDVPAGDSPIIAVIVGSPADALTWQNRFKLAGCYVPAIRPPTVPPDTSRLRISLSALHTADQIDQMLDTFLSVTSVR